MSVVGCKQVEEEWYIKNKKNSEKDEERERKNKARNRGLGGVDGFTVVGGDHRKGGGARGKNIEKGEG